MSNLSLLPPTPSLDPSNRDDAIRLLKAYYASLLDRGMGFEGGWWDGFDPSGTRDSTPDEFTADDLLSASLLSAPIHPTAVLQILGGEAASLTIALKVLGRDRELASLSTSEVKDLEAESTIWHQLRAIPFIGQTRTSKLIARKRPHLVPVYDRIVGEAVYGGSSAAQWTRLHATLTADDGALNEHLKSLRLQAGLPDWISLLRIFDVIAWLDASGKAQSILNHPDSATGGADPR